jgi:hypothetical protein
MHVKRFSASDVFDIECGACIPGNPAFLNILFRHTAEVKTAAEKLVGPGVYAVFYRSSLIYIGSFCGQQYNPYAGNIVGARWDKHIGTFTGRGQKVSLSKIALGKVVVMNNLVGQGFARSQSSVVHRDRGMQATYNRLSFAAQNWGAFSKLKPSELEQFLFVYVRLERTDTPGALTTARVRTLVRAAEDALVNHCLPCCNAKIKGGNLSSPYRPDEVVKMIETCLQAQVQAVCAAEPDASGATAGEWLTGRPARPTPSRRSLTSAIRETEEPEERFYDSIQGPARDLVDALTERLDDPPKNAANFYEVHFTHTNAGDLRVRAHPAKGRAQNVFTMTWQPRLRQFRCRARNQPAKVAGIVCIKGPVHAGEPLLKAFVVVPNGGDLAAQIDALVDAITCSDLGPNPTPETRKLSTPRILPPRPL